MTPDTGQGANCAIEDAAALANIIGMTIAARNPTWKMQLLLKQFNQTRLLRVKEIYQVARLVARLHTRETFALRVLGRYCLPFTGNLAVNKVSRIIAGAVQLSFLPPSQRAATSWQKFHPGNDLLLRYTLIIVILFLAASVFFVNG